MSNDIDKTKRVKSEAYALAGWSSYCLGDFDAAQSDYRHAIEVDGENAKFHYFLAKVLFAKNDILEASREFEQAIDRNYTYALRAAYDPEFIDNKDVVTEVINKVRNNRQTVIINKCASLSEVVSKETSAIISRYLDQKNQSSRAYSLISKTVQQFLDEPRLRNLLELFNVEKLLNEEGLISSAVLEAKEKIGSKTDELEARDLAAFSSEADPAEVRNVEKYKLIGFCALGISAAIILLFTTDFDNIFLSGIIFSILARLLDTTLTQIKLQFWDTSEVEILEPIGQLLTGGHMRRLDSCHIP